MKNSSGREAIKWTVSSYLGEQDHHNIFWNVYSRNRFAVGSGIVLFHSSMGENFIYLYPADWLSCFPHIKQNPREIMVREQQRPKQLKHKMIFKRYSGCSQVVSRSMPSLLLYRVLFFLRPLKTMLSLRSESLHKNIGSIPHCPNDACKKEKGCWGCVCCTAGSDPLIFLI